MRLGIRIKMLIKDYLKDVFDNEQVLCHAKEILFSEYVVATKVENTYTLYFDDVGNKEAEFEKDKVKFTLQAIVLQYDLMNNDSQIRVVIRVGDYTNCNGLVDSTLGRIVLYYNEETLKDSFYPTTSDYLFMMGYNIN